MRSEPNRCRVLHIGGISGASEVLARDLGSDLIWRGGNVKGTSISGAYPGHRLRGVLQLRLWLIRNAWRYDIIHIHGAEGLTPLCAAFAKVVLHYHGTDIRSTGSAGIARRICRSFADHIIYNSTDMEPLIRTVRPVKKTYVPNMIDESMFRPARVSRDRDGLTMMYAVHDRRRIMERVVKAAAGRRVTFHDRTRHGFVRYPDMPAHLSRYRKYYDVRYLPGLPYVLPDLSLTALQALACGCEVYHRGTVMRVFPEKHRAENVLGQVRGIYAELLA